MLQLLKDKFDYSELTAANFGVEREALRVNDDGTLATTKHPKIFGDKLKHPYVTTDFSESQVELITPCFKTPKEVHSFLNSLYDITVLHIGNEVLWPQSTPCKIPENVPIAEYGQDEMGQMARSYRESLREKYGSKKQLLCGIHYNFSFSEPFIQKLSQEMQSELTYKDFKSQIYLKMIRNFLTHRWLIIYLLGATPVVHESIFDEVQSLTALKDRRLDARIDKESYTSPGMISYRNSDNGYKNSQELYPDYSSVEAYIESIEKLIDEGVIQGHSELYSQIRPKAKQKQNFLQSLKDEGIQYIEIRNIDNNPFDKAGISTSDLEFLHLFMLYLLIKEEETGNEYWQEEGNANQRIIAKRGLIETPLWRNSKAISKTEWALEILEEIQMINQELQLDKSALIEEMMERVNDPNKTHAARLIKRYKEEGFIKTNLQLANLYKHEAVSQRYKLCGYENMELSTQILMKEAMTRGIEVEVLDPLDNFIALKQDSHREYVKQATKTSKDSYMTMLIMENKTVTKSVLKSKGIQVPEGTEVYKGQNIEKIASYYAGRPIVVKPKSTNFGTGISIFPQGGCAKDIQSAIEIGLKHDDTVLIETFAKGKEYRFLVIGEEVAGVLHRVPANVMGDGEKTIRELVAIKNQDSLRGEGYKTPLERIHLDASSELFLSQSNLNFDSVPDKGEIVYLRENSNISTGGDSIDYTDTMPKYFKDIAVQAAQAVGAKFCGVDMMIEDYVNSNSPYAIIELNFNPAIHIHSYPYIGSERNIAEKVLQVLGFKL